MSEAKILAVLERIETRLTAHEQAIRHIVDMQVIHNEKLDAILLAATREPGPSPVAEMMRGVIGALNEQGELLRDLPNVLAVAIREELHRELEFDDADMEEASPEAFTRDDRAAPGT